MTFTEAVASGKNFRRVGMDSYYDLDTFTTDYGLDTEDVLASDYELEPDSSISITRASFDAAWNSARAGSLAIKPAGSSEFYKKLAASLGLS